VPAQAPPPAPVGPAVTPPPPPSPADEIDTPAEEALADAVAEEAVMSHDNRTILIIGSIVAAFLFVALVVGGWFGYDTLYATPDRALGSFFSALDSGDDAGVDELLAEDLARDLDDLDAGGSSEALVEACGLTAKASDFEQVSADSRKAVYEAEVDDAVQRLTLRKEGYGSWVVDEVRSATIETATEPVPPPAGDTDYVDTEYLASGVTLPMHDGSPGEAEITYEVPLVNGEPGERDEIDRDVTREPEPATMWRGTGSPADDGIRVYDIQTGAGGNEGEPGVRTQLDTMPMSQDEFMVGFQFEPTPAGTTARVVWLSPSGETLEDGIWDPDDTWTWSWVRYYISDDYMDIVPGRWVAAILINEEPADYATFEITR